MDIKKIIKEHYDQLCAHKFDNLYIMDQFLEIYNLPVIAQKEIDNISRLLPVKEIESIVNNLTKQKAPGSDEVTEFY